MRKIQRNFLYVTSEYPVYYWCSGRLRKIYFVEAQYTECPGRKGQYSGRLHYWSF